MYSSIKIWGPLRGEHPASILRLHPHPPHHHQLLSGAEDDLEGGDSMGEEQLQLQILFMGELEKPLKPLFKIYMGIY